MALKYSKNHENTVITARSHQLKKSKGVTLTEWKETVRSCQNSGLSQDINNVGYKTARSRRTIMHVTSVTWHWWDQQDLRPKIS